jgi:hypothetical protein
MIPIALKVVPVKPTYKDEKAEQEKADSLEKEKD